MAGGAPLGSLTLARAGCQIPGGASRTVSPAKGVAAGAGAVLGAGAGAVWQQRAADPSVIAAGAARVAA
eukprot:gene7143-24902_t